MGERNTEMAAYFQRPRPRYRTARQLGMQAVLFQSTTQAISEVEACLADPGG